MCLVAVLLLSESPGPFRYSLVLSPAHRPLAASLGESKCGSPRWTWKAGDPTRVGSEDLACKYLSPVAKTSLPVLAPSASSGQKPGIVESSKGQAT